MGHLWIIKELQDIEQLLGVSIVKTNQDFRAIQAQLAILLRVLGSSTGSTDLVSHELERAVRAVSLKAQAIDRQVSDRTNLTKRKTTTWP